MSASRFEKLFNALPVPLQNLALSVEGWKSRRKRYGPAFREKLAWLRESEWATRDEIAAYQRAQIQRVVEHAYETTPYYREVLSARNLTPADIRGPEDLSKLPVLTKETVRQRGADLLSQRYQTSALLKIKTSGTSGKALDLWETPDCLQFQWAVWWRHRARFGLRLGDPFLMFGTGLPMDVNRSRPPYWRENWAFRQTYLLTYLLTPESMPTVIDFLNRRDFDFYTGRSSSMAIVAGYMERHGIRLTNRPKYIVSGSESLLPSVEKLLQQVWGVPVTDQYGAAERCANMSRCASGLYHDDYEFGYTETIENPDDPGGPKRIIATGFANPAMPLIRYDIGDLTTFTDAPCACGRQSRIALRIDGRTEDYIRTPDGRLILGVSQIFHTTPNAQETQVVQECESAITLRIVRRPAWCDDDERALLNALRQRTGPELRIDVDYVDHIPRAANGKFRAVVSSLARTGGRVERALHEAVRGGGEHATRD